MAFNPWNKNKQKIIIHEDPAKSQDGSASRRSNQLIEPSNFINMNRFKSLHHQEYYYGSTSRGSVDVDEQANFININRLKLFGRSSSNSSSSSSSTTTHEDNPIANISEVDCTLRLGFPPEPPISKQQQQQVPNKPPGGDDHHLSVPQAMMQKYEVRMNGRGTHSYHPQINNRLGMNNINQNNYQLHQQIMNNNNNNNRIVGNLGMFHGGGGSSSMNVGGSYSSSSNFGMFNGGRGGGGPSSVVVALPSPGVGSNMYPLPHPPPPPPPTNFHIPFPNNNILPPPLPPPPPPPPAPPVFVAAPRRNEPYHHNHPPPPEPERRCLACDTTRTPLWRNGPKGPKSLCNACGIRYKKEARRIMGLAGADGGQQGETAYSYRRIGF